MTADLLGEPRSVRYPVISANAADTSEFLRFVTENTGDDGLVLPANRPFIEGSLATLNVQARATQERICAVLVQIEKQIPPAEGKPAGVAVRVVRLEPGCDEELRRALSTPALAAKARPKPPAEGPVIGIDLGTTFSCAAIVENGTPRVIHSSLGYSTVPSIVTFDDRGLPVTGQLAERRMVREPERVVYGAKRFIGRPYSKALVEQFGSHMRYEIVADSEGLAAVKMEGRVLSPIEVGACILSEMKRVAEHELRQTVTQAVITVPAAFTENQRSAVREAGRRAGLTVRRIVNEPTAAALAYGYRQSNQQKTILVYDLGGGTFDVSVLQLSGSVYSVRATGGDTFLGGMDFDRGIVEHLRAELLAKYGDGVTLDRIAEERFAAAAIEAKHTLSSTHRANIMLPNLKVGGLAESFIDFTTALTREQLEQIVAPLIDRTIAICDEALGGLSLAPRDVDDVLLVGGQTRAPLVQSRLQAHFGKRPSQRVHPDEVVALGAAILAASLEQVDGPTLIDVLPIPIGIADEYGSMQQVLRHHTILPAIVKIQVEPPEGRPLVVAVFQGLRLRAADNEFLGSFSYAVPSTLGISRKVELTFALDAECLLTITSKILATNEEKEHRLATQQTSDQVLERLGSTRVGRERSIPPPRPAVSIAPQWQVPVDEQSNLFTKLVAWLKGEN